MGIDVKLVFLRKTESGNVYLPLLKGINWDVMSIDNTSLMTPLYNILTGIFMPDRRGDGRLDYDLIRAFPNYIINYKPDLIICHDQWAGLAGYYTFRKYGIKFVTLLHESLGKYNVPVLGKLASVYEKKVLKNSYKIFAINEKIAKSVNYIYGLSAIVDYHGMDIKKRPDYESKSNLILANSTWDSNRATDIYLKILEALPNFKMQMIGRWRDSDLKLHYEKLVSQNNLEARLELRENVPENEMEELYLRSKFLIRFGYKENGNPHGIIDALSYGTVPILNAELGISKIIKEFDAGIVVEHIDVVSIINGINKFDNVDKYTQIQSNMNKLSSLYTWETHCKVILDNI